MGQKATKAETERRIEAAMTLLGRGLRDGEIKRVLAAQFHIPPRTAERYITRGRRALLERLGRTKEEMRAGSLAFYEGVLSDTKATTRDKLLARKRIDDLLGLDEPKRLEHSGPRGGPIETETHDRDAMRRVMTDPAAMELAQMLADRADAEDEDERGSAPAAKPHANGSLNGHRNGDAPA